jgi:Putative restriction endonuclease
MLLMDRPTGRVETSGPLTLREYLALPEDTRAEIVDGVLRPMTRANRLHRTVQRRIANVIETQKLPELRVVEEEVVVF